MFRAYASGGLDGPSDEMDMEEFRDFVVECDLETKTYPFNVMTSQFTKVNSGADDDNTLELHEFLTMLVRIAIFRANPSWGLKGKVDASGASKIEWKPLPGCLQAMLAERVLPNARRDTTDFASTFNSAAVQEVVRATRNALLEWFELVSGGKDTIDLERWTKALEERFLLSSLVVHGHKCRFSQPQSKAAFLQSCADPRKGLAPDELLECVARCGVAKYRAVEGMDAAASVEGFAQNLLGHADEEQVIVAITGGEVGGQLPTIGEEDVAPGRRSSLTR